MLASNPYHIIIQEIERLGFGYHENPQFDISNLSPKRRVQVRDSEHYAPKVNVVQFAEQMSMTALPPIVVTSDDYIVDGNTRVGALLLKKHNITPAIVVDVPYEGSSEKVQSELHALAATLNQTGGQRLTPKEIRLVTTKLIGLGWKPEQIGRAIGAKGSTVAQVKREINANSKLQKVGIATAVLQQLKDASLRALGKDNATGLNNEPFKSLAVLTADAGLTASEISAFADELRDAGSDATALKRLADLRVEMATRIREHALTGAGKPASSRQLRQHLGFLERFEGNAQELVEVNPATAQTHLDKLEQAKTILDAVIQAQRERIARNA